MKLNRRELILVALLTLALGATALHLLVWQPLMDERDSLNVAVHSLRMTLARLEPWEGREADLELRIAALKEEIFVATVERKPGIPLPDSLVLLEDLARAAAVRLTSTSIQADEEQGMFSAQVTGNYFDLYRFMTILEQRDDALTLEGAQMSGTGDNMSLSLRIRLFSGIIPGLPQEGGFPNRSPFVPRR